MTGNFDPGPTVKTNVLRIAHNYALFSLRIAHRDFYNYLFTECAKNKTMKKWAKNALEMGKLSPQSNKSIICFLSSRKPLPGRKP